MLTLRSDLCELGPPCAPVYYSYTIDGAGQTLTLTCQPMPGGGTATLRLTRK
jgi:hypothetical protein